MSIQYMFYYIFNSKLKKQPLELSPVYVIISQDKTKIEYIKILKIQEYISSVIIKTGNISTIRKQIYGMRIKRCEYMRANEKNKIFKMQFYNK